MKERLDVMMVRLGLAPSREKARAVIMAGEVLVDGQREDKPGSMFPDTVSIIVKGNPIPYVSRGGLKLAKAVDAFGLKLEGRICMDVGSSTGGFTDCMLQNAVKPRAAKAGFRAACTGIWTRRAWAVSVRVWPSISGPVPRGSVCLSLIHISSRSSIS